MEKGYKFPEQTRGEITHIQLVRYAGASGDFNPIHTVVSAAQKAGFADVIAHGMLIMGFVGQAIASWVPLDNLLQFKVRFQAITQPGEKITVSGSVVDETEEAWVCEATAANQHGEVKLTAAFMVKK